MRASSRINRINRIATPFTRRMRSSISSRSAARRSSRLVRLHAHGFHPPLLRFNLPVHLVLIILIQSLLRRRTVIPSISRLCCLRIIPGSQASRSSVRIAAASTPARSSHSIFCSRGSRRRLSESIKTRSSTSDPDPDPADPEEVPVPNRSGRSPPPPTAAIA